MTQTILLTGGAGYIGSHTHVALIEAGYRVVLLDNFSNAKRSVLDRLARITGEPVTCEEVDVLDRAALDGVFQRHKIDAVIHFAARKAVGESVEKPLEYFQTNLAGLITLAQAMQAAGVFRIVFSSSATVYGAPDILPVPEEAAVQYASPYAYTKLAGEQMLGQLHASEPRWQVGILRYFNPVGAHASGLIGEDPQGIPNNLMPYIEKVAIGTLPELGIFGDDYETPDGTGVRDYVHVSDLAEGHVLSVGALLGSHESHLVNLGTGQGYSVLDVVRAYSRACGRDLPTKVGPRRAGDVAIYYADPAKAAEVLGFEASRDLDEMCASSWKWIQWAAQNAE